jgi:spermidine synthase
LLHRKEALRKMAGNFVDSPMRRARKPPDEIAICQDNAAGHVTYIQDAVNQSMADANGVSLAEYIHAIFGLVMQLEPSRVLLIGCGGGTLATMLNRRDVRVTMLDINPASFAIARAHFALPKRVACHVADGLAFLQERPRRYDAIVLDAYDGARIPSQFLKPAFMRLVQSRLRPGGGFFVNVIARRIRDPYVREVEGVMAKAWDGVRVLGAKTGGHHNAVVMAGAVEGLKRPKLDMPPLVGRGELRRDLGELVFRN